MEGRLRECPCGHESHVIFEDGLKVADPWSVACKNFDCPWVFQTFPSREKAISAWNTRATDPLLEEMASYIKMIINLYDFKENDLWMEDGGKLLKKYREATCQQEKK